MTTEQIRTLTELRDFHAARAAHIRDQVRHRDLITHPSPKLIERMSLNDHDRFANTLTAILQTNN